MRTKSSRPTTDSWQGLRAKTVRYLDSLGFFGWQLGLERIEKLCAFLSQPQNRYPCVHIAGTNGKGSTAAMLAAIAQAAGLKTGLYTSPHLVHVAERMQINGRLIPGEELERFVEKLRPRIDELKATYFEALTAIAFAYFAEQRIDLAIVETGLGGRLDATNIVTPEVAIITSIGLEHRQYLGKTLAQIAREKAGIIKAGRPCLSGVKSTSAKEIIAAQCLEMGAPFLHARDCAQISAIKLTTTGSTFHLSSPRLDFDYPKLLLNLPGRHQIDNARLAVIAAHLLRERRIILGDGAILQGLAQVHWPARMQLLKTSPPILIDAAHNPEGMRMLVQALQESFPQKKMRVVMSLLKDKAAVQVLRAWQNLRPKFFFAPVAAERAMPAELLAQTARQFRFKHELHASPAAALKAALQNAGKQDLVVVAGSHYLLGELMAGGLLPYPYRLKDFHAGENA